MCTELLLKKWVVQKMNGIVIPAETATMPVIEITDVYDSYADAGCDKIIFTPKFGHGNRILFAHTQITERNCKGATQLDVQLLKNFQDAYYWALINEKLLLKNKEGFILIEAITAN